MQRLFRTRVFSATGSGFRGCWLAHSEASLLPQNDVQQRQRGYFRDHSRPSIFYFYKKPVVFEYGTCDPVEGFMAEAIQGIRNGTPLGAVLTTPEIAQLPTHRSYFNTFGGNPVCTSAAHAILRVLEKEKLQENAFSVGSYLKQPLDSLKEKYKSDVRGRGLMLDVELVTDRHLKTPAKTEILHVMDQMKDVGVHIGGGGFHGNVFRITPPLCFRREDAGNCWPAQELVGCDNTENQGCNGGLMEFEFIKKNGGINTKRNYIYTAEDGTCEAQKENSNAASSDGHESHDSDSDLERFDFDEKDLESDDSLWALYERWQKHHRVSRGPKEMQKRFNVFKKKAKYIHQFNKESGEDEDSCKLGLNKFGDMSVKEVSSKYCGAISSNYCDAIPSNYYGALVRHSPKLKPNSTYGGGWKVKRKRKSASRIKSFKSY